MSEIQSSYDSVASTFARSRRRSWPDITELIRQLESCVISNNQSDSIGDVLDVGCGSGRLLDYLPKYQTYIGIDISDGLLKIAENERLGKMFVKLDMHDIDQLRQKFDTIFFIASFHHLTDPKEHDEVLRKTIWQLNSGGIICMLNWNLRSSQNCLKYSKAQISDSVFRIPISGHPRLYYAFSVSEIESLFQRVGCNRLYNGLSETWGNILSIFQKI